MKLYLIRHGETAWNRERRMQGQTDIPLNENGEALARRTGEGLRNIPFAVCYTSPLKRARRTAELILEGRKTPIIDDARLVEMGFGVYEGKCFLPECGDVGQEFQDGFFHPERYRHPEDGESFDDLMRRTGAFLDEIRGKKEYEEANILISTHGAALSSMLAVMRHASLREFWGNGVHKNCAVTEVAVTREGFLILSENSVYSDDTPGK